MRKAGRIIITLIFIMLFITAALTSGGYFLNSPQESSTDSLFSIERGSSVTLIAYRLQETGLIRSADFFILLTRIQGTQGNLQAGNFFVPAGYSALQIHDLFLSGTEVLVSVTIAEGLTLSRIARILSDSAITDHDEFLEAAHNPALLYELNIPGNSAQGFIYPDTYRFSLGFPAEKVLVHLVRNFWKNLESIYPDYTMLSRSQIYERIILASIIEREYRVAEEAPYMASVFFNRIQIGMPLQSCATVVYALTEEHGRPHPRFLTYADLEINSAFNTYRIPGLPPAPIGNPGRVAIHSAFFPASSDYLFFVLRNPDDGQHFFSRTLSEHNQARRIYIKER